jgi:hypothetical protein
MRILICLIACLTLMACANPGSRVKESTLKTLSGANLPTDVRAINVIRSPIDISEISNSNVLIRNQITNNWNSPVFDIKNRFGDLFMKNLEANGFKVGYRGAAGFDSQPPANNAITVFIRCKKITSQGGNTFFFVLVTVLDLDRKTPLFEYEDEINGGAYGKDRTPYFDNFTFRLLNLLRDKGVISRNGEFVLSQ